MSAQNAGATNQSRSRRAPPRKIAACVFLACFSPLAIGCGRTDGSAGRTEGESDQSEAAAMRVTPIQPARKTLVRWTEQPGQIEAFEETPLYAKVAGYVEKMY